MPFLDYQSEDTGPSRPAGSATCLVGLLLGLAACGILVYGIGFLQDQIVGTVVNSHYHAWLYTAPYAGALSTMGAALCIWAIGRRPHARGYAIVALIWNILALGVFLISLIDRQF